MYEEDKNSINWFKIVLRLVIVLLVILLSIKLITIILSNKTNVTETNVMDQSLKQMENVAKDYFKDDNLPTKTGEKLKVTLSELIDKKLIDNIKDNDGKECDKEKSYIRVTKLDNEYQIKANLVCGDKEDYITSNIKIDEESTTTKKTKTTKKQETTTSKTTTKKQDSTNNTTTVKTTKKTTVKTTVKKKYSVSFNTNGGTQIETQTITENGIIKNVVPTREGYIFAGWYYHGVKFDVNTKIKQDYVLTAKWIVG